jgi:hypothetical protein
MLKKLPLLFCAGVLAAVAITTGCSSQPSHPNQLSAFDGATYNSLTAAHAALVSLRSQVAVLYPRYAGIFNEAAAAYDTAFTAYSGFRTAPADPAAITVAVNNLTVSIVSMENAFSAGMNADPKTAISVRRKAEGIKAHLQQRMSISDILTELEIAAAVAQRVPQAQPYAALASMVIDAASAAIAAEETSSGQAIDLSTIQPVPLI